MNQKETKMNQNETKVVEITESMVKKMKQETYVYYMMVGSYFKHCRCSNKRWEQRLFLYYKDLPLGKQEKLEGKVLKHLSKELAGMEQYLEKEDCTVRFYKLPKDAGRVLWFEAEELDLFVTIGVDGKCSVGKYKPAEAA